MEDKALSELLNEYDKKISESISINTQLLSELKTKKSYSQLKKILRNRLIELAISSVLSFLLVGYIYYSWNLRYYGCNFMYYTELYLICCLKLYKTTNINFKIQFEPACY